MMDSPSSLELKAVKMQQLNLEVSAIPLIMLWASCLDLVKEINA